MFVNITIANPQSLINADISIAGVNKVNDVGGLRFLRISKVGIFVIANFPPLF